MPAKKKPQVKNSSGSNSDADGMDKKDTDKTKTHAKLEKGSPQEFDSEEDTGPSGATTSGNPSTAGKEKRVNEKQKEGKKDHRQEGEYTQTYEEDRNRNEEKGNSTGITQVIQAITENLGQVWDYCKKNKTAIMTYSTLLSLGYMLGAITTYFMVGPQYREHQVQVVVDRVIQDKFQAAEKQLRTNYSGVVDRKVGTLNKTFTNMVNVTAKTFNSSLTSLNSTLRQEMFENNTKMEQRVNASRDILNDRQDQLDQRLGLEPSLMEIRGFMKIETFGPVLLALASVEILIMFCMCALAGRVINTPGHRRDAPVPNGDAVQPAQANPPTRLVATNNSNILFLCFRNSDEDRSHTMGSQLVQRCPRRISKRTYVVNSLEDIEYIPECRAALVFVDPDEREMIIEDQRYHIGQGLRRHAVQRLLDSGVAVFIIIFNDRNPPTLGNDQLYNRRLGQIKEHAQLKMLSRDDHVLSIRDTFTEFQLNHVDQELRRIYT